MNKQNEYYLTQEGVDRLRTELEELKGPKRTELSERLRKAVRQGDLSENADYIKAKEDQGFLEGRIQELETLLSNAVIIEQNSQDGVVAVGSHVTIQEGNFPKEDYFLVGPTEADPSAGRISNESPIGQALIGHREGEIVVVETPGGKIKLKILKVH
jgi:transcription elongation factor GreA